LPCPPLSKQLSRERYASDERKKKKKKTGDGPALMAKAEEGKNPAPKRQTTEKNKKTTRGSDTLQRWGDGRAPDD